MSWAVHGIYNGSKRYFHLQCIDDVICYPEQFSHNIVDRALWCHDEFKHEKALHEKEIMKRASRVTDAQETLECLS